MLVCGISDFLPQAITVMEALPGQRERSRPEHHVTEGLVTSAEDRRLEETLLIGLSQYGLPCQTRIQYEMTRQDLHLHSIGWLPNKSMTQAK